MSGYLGQDSWDSPTPEVAATEFHIAGIPVRVELPFFIVALLLGLGGHTDPLILAWVAIVFVSVLVHELGHAVTGLAFGGQVRIVLHALGGVTYRMERFPRRCSSPSRTPQQ